VVQATCTNLQRITTAEGMKGGTLIMSEGLFSAITQALIYTITKEKLVLAMVI
jgi:hypothetical protein